MIQTITDPSLVLHLAMMEGAEIGLSKEKIQPEKVLAHLQISANHGGLFATVEPDGYHSGALALFPVESWWGDNVTYCSLMLYVDKRYRGKNGLMLLKAAKQFHQRTSKEVNIFVDSSENLETKDRLFKMNGFESRGGNYRLRSV